MRTWRITGLVLLLFLTGCQSDQPDPTLQQLVGLWQWKQSSGGIDGEVTLPEKGEPKRRLKIVYGDVQSAEGVVIFKNDNEETDRKRFTISYEPSIYDTKPGPALRFEGEDSYRMIRFSDDGQTMTLSDNVADGYSDTYERLY